MTDTAGMKNVRASGGTDNRYEAALRLFGAFSGVEPEYLEASENYAETKAASGTAVLLAEFFWKYGKTMAAAALCVAVVGLGWLSYRLSGASGSMNSAEDNMASTGINYSAAGSEECAAADSAEFEACEESAAETTADMPVEAVEDLMAERKEENDGGSTESNKQQLAANPEGAAGNQQEAMEESQIEKEASVDTAMNGVCQPQPMTLEETAALQTVGAYLPSVWPADGRLTEVRGCDLPGEECIWLTWTYGNGWDSFFLSLNYLGTELSDPLQKAVADVAKPETYDARLYEIPYGDTVPEAYREVFGNPVFRAEDFSKECVEARIQQNAGDAGDTNMPRGNFRVLYRTDEGGYVLADFSGRGSADEIWKLLDSIR